jgi:hypothetical protein
LEPHYLSSGAIVKINPPVEQYVNRSLFVEKSSGGYRLVFDLKYLN